MRCVIMLFLSRYIPYLINVSNIWWIFQKIKTVHVPTECKNIVDSCDYIKFAAFSDPYSMTRKIVDV